MSENLFYDDENLVSVSNSILKYFHLDTYHPSLRSLDDRLKRNKNKKVALILLDGFSKHIQEVYYKYCPFIREHNSIVISSVFPPTTVAATTSLLSAKYPCETGWLGWTEKLNKYVLPIVMFFNVLADNKTKIDEKMSDVLPYDSIIALMNQKGIKANMIQSFTYPKDNVKKYFKKASKLINENDFTYIYHTEPDSSLHRYGVGSKKIRKYIQQFDEELKKLTEAHKDTLFILLADHGHKNATYFNIKEHQDFYDTLKMKAYALEGRAAMFEVLDDKKEEFETLAKQYYGEHFYIFNKEEIKEKEIFGKGEPCEKFDELVLDYLLISKDDSVFKDDYSANLKSHHAGTSYDEKYLNVSLYNFN